MVRTMTKRIQVFEPKTPIYFLRHRYGGQKLFPGGNTIEEVKAARDKMMARDIYIMCDADGVQVTKFPKEINP